MNDFAFTGELYEYPRYPNSRLAIPQGWWLRRVWKWDSNAKTFTIFDERPVDSIP